MSKRNLFVGAVVMVTLFATFLFLQRGKKTKVTPSEREVVAPLEATIRVNGHALPYERSFERAVAWELEQVLRR